ncbi:MAG TPA: class II aldolase/adducin family protein [Actinoplanes sp.]|jgi:L-fuculose-phosphate aldolase
MSSTLPAPVRFRIDEGRVAEFLRYAQLLANRGYVCNTLGNIALRAGVAGSPLGNLVYTKHRGISLEEMSAANIVVTDLAGALVHGEVPTSVGHQMNRRILELRPDVNCVMHVHIDHVIGYFSVLDDAPFELVSADAALVLQAPVEVLEPSVNIESDVSLIESFIDATNCIVMPNHGVTTMGATASEAYHRMTTLAAEVARLIAAGTVANLWGRKINYVSAEETAEMYAAGKAVIYGA